MSLDTKTNQWNQVHEKHFEFYQDQIDRITYGLQRAQRGSLFFGHRMYPFQYQKDILDLQLLQRKQWLGEVNQKEVDQYKQINPDIASDLNRTFNVHYPWKGFMVGLIGFLAMHRFNVSYSYRMSTMALAISTECLLHQYIVARRGVKFNALEFLDWNIESRKALCQLERNKDKLNQQLVQDYSKKIGSVNVHQALEQFNSL